MYGNKGQVRDVIMDWTIFQRNISIFMHLFLARYLWNTISNDNSVYVFVFLPDIHIYERFGLQNLFQPIVRVWQVYCPIQWQWEKRVYSIIYMMNVAYSITRPMAITVLEFQVREYNISNFLAQGWMCIKKTSTSFTCNVQWF